jgi:uncharacterized protein (DUF302 family)
MPPYEEVPVPAEPAIAVGLLREALRTRGITEYVVVDHARDMAAAGVRAHPAWTVVFGSPKAGEPVLAHDLRAAVDIPLRLAVIGAGPGSSLIVLRPMETLLDTGFGTTAAAMTATLRALAAAVARAAA